MYDQKAWFAGLGHRPAPIWKYNTYEGSADDCSCLYSQSFDAISTIYEPLSLSHEHIDTPRFDNAHPFPEAPGTRARWRNGKWYATAALIKQQRQWFAWRVRTRQVLENLYCGLRLNQNKNPEEAYALLIDTPYAQLPALEEQIPFARLEDEYQRRLVHYALGGVAPHKHELREGPEPGAEPPMPASAEVGAPSAQVLAERNAQHAWLLREQAVKAAAMSLFEQRGEAGMKPPLIVGTGVGERDLVIDYQGEMTRQAVEQIRSAITIQFGGRVSVQ